MPPGLPGSASGSLLLEEPLIRTPYELLRRSHRTAQRQVEKDFKGVQSMLSGLLKSFDDKPISQEKRATVNSKLDLGIDKFRGLKRKLDDLQPSESQPSVLKARLRYLDGIIASGATERQATVEVKIEPLEDATLPIQIKVETETTLMTEEGDIKKEGMDEDMPLSSERAASPLAPEPVHEDKNIARYLVDYLLRKGYMKTAQAVTDGAKIEQLVDIKLFAELSRIEYALLYNHSVTEALAWCGENRGTLKKTKNNLEFTLRMQEYIELCRQRKVPEAIVYSRKNLAPWAATHLVELQQAMTLLAFGEKSGVALYRRLYERSRWLDVRTQFRQTFLSLYGLPSQSLLCLSSFAGLATLRLPSCARHRKSGFSDDIPLRPAAPPLHDLDDILSTIYTDSIGSPPATATEPLDIETGNIDCPSCDVNLRVLTGQIPMSHHVNSTLVCRISGEVMDSENEPLAFPNGNVYSSKALREMAKRTFDVVTCPRTKESCAFSKLRKVYIS